jgi:tripartite-type tricarboxylate transporter receptor subunit TctC
MLKLPRRQVLRLAAGAAALPLASRIAWAQAYPARTITLIVFAPAGGSPDIKARILGQLLSQRLGQAIVVENRPGAGGHLALQAVARAPADGYTLLLVATPHAVNATLHEQVTVIKDIEPVAGITGDPFIMVVNPTFPAKTVPEFIAYAKANPGKINVTSSGSGNLSHLSAELFRMLAGVDMVHVPYKGTVAALTGVMAGEVHLMFDAMTSALPHVQAGRLHALGVTSTKPVDVLPGVPTVAAAVPGYVVNGVLGIGAPKGTPPDVVNRLNKEINALLADPGPRGQLAGLGSTVFSGAPADFGQYVRDDVDKWAKVVKFANVKTQ